MSIRLLAQDLYRLQQEVDALRERLIKASPDEVEDLQEQLRKIEAERLRLRRILDGRIDRPKRPLH
jgi:hypothetical protein